MDLHLPDLKFMRKKLGLTQQELAKQAAVSQSLIAKIESSKIDPTYSHVQKIAEALNRLNKKQELKASQIMQTKIIAARPDDKIALVIEKMKKYGISQMPVIDNNTAVGTISETALLHGLLQHKGEQVKELMEEAPPIVAGQTGITLITNLLQFSSMVLVAEKGKLTGVITKSDVLNNLKGF